MAAALDTSTLSALLDGRWAITEDGFARLEALMLQGPRSLAREPARPMDDRGDVQLRGSVAVIPVTGPLFLAASPWWTSYEQLAQDIQRACSNPTVSAVVLDCNSPGGQAMGVTELADQIAELRSSKPIVAYVGSMACSAAYVLASACSRIVANEGAMVGSLGVCMTVFSAQRMYEAMGIDRKMVVSSVSPYKNLIDQKGLTEDAVADAKRLVDALGSVLVDKVAGYRGIAAKDVLAQYGQGRVIAAGKGGLEAGLVDAIGSFESVIASLSSQSVNTKEGNQSMKAIAKALGLPEGATEADIQAELARREAAAAAATTRARTAEAALQSEQAASRQARVDALIERGLKEGRIIPATESFFRDMCGEAGGFERLEKALPKMPIVGAPSGLDGKRPPAADNTPGQLSPEDLKWCKRHNIDPAAFLAARDDDDVQSRLRRSAGDRFLNNSDDAE